MKSELARLPRIIILGKLSVDNEKITESEASRLWGIIIRAYQGEQRTDSELVRLVLEIIHRQNPQISEEELLRTVFDEEHTAASIELVTTIVKYTVLYYNLHHWVESYIARHSHEKEYEEDIRQLRRLGL